ncbi:MAG TPA: hypothetical protein VFY85_09160 [Gemmatimonadaceae bacterium]|nr:hypothetical protein [Gemmatimonadaceae bacterium]
MKALALMALLLASAAQAQQTVVFSTNAPDGRLGMASRPGGAGISAREAADDFVLQEATAITGASFYGLLPTGASALDITQVSVEIYRIFPLDSSDPPSGNVPTRLNSPSDVAFDTRTSGSGLTWSATSLGGFSVTNSVVDGIHPSPNNMTGGDGFATGNQFLFAVDLLTPFVLPANHYFFVPQVGLSNGTFLWLSAQRPIVSPGTPFPPMTTDLQAWIRSAELEPDWLRVGTDIIGGGQTFNGAFSLSTTVIATPEPTTLVLVASGLLLIVVAARRIGWSARDLPRRSDVQ